VCRVDVNLALWGEYGARGIHFRSVFRSPKWLRCKNAALPPPPAPREIRVPGNRPACLGAFCGVAGASPGGMGPPQLGSYSGAPSGSLRAKGTRILSPFSTSEWKSFTQNQNYAKMPKTTPRTNT
jgi:hypothetical protein